MKVAVVGMGLIGGSFYKASLRAGHEVIGLHHGESNGLSEAELIIVCLPPEAIIGWIREHAKDFAQGAVVVDICGIKRKIMREMAEVPRSGWTFVGGHPMAGREVSGYANSKESLFDGASMILTPFAGTAPEIIERLKRYFATLGFIMTIVTTPERHDDMIAFTSQLCHVIATVYARDPRVKEVTGFSAGSYANMTRIATQNENDWSALYSSNRENLVGVLDDFLNRFKEMRDAIALDDGAEVRRQIVEGTAAKRQDIINQQRGDEK